MAVNESIRDGWCDIHAPGKRTIYKPGTLANVTDKFGKGVQINSIQCVDADPTKFTWKTGVVWRVKMPDEFLKTHPMPELIPRTAAAIDRQIEQPATVSSPPRSTAA